MDISANITQIPGIGDAFAKKVNNLGIYSIFDFLYHIPFRYEDRQNIVNSGTAQAGETVTIVGELEQMKNDITRKGKFMQNAKINDGSGSLNITWFNQPFLSKTLHPGQKIAVHGKVDLFVGKKTMLAPEYEIKSDTQPLLHVGRIVPIYPETAGVSSKWIRAKIFTLLALLSNQDAIPISHTIAWKTALQDIHFPSTYEKIEPARQRLAQDELTLYQLKGLRRRIQWHQTNQAPTIQINPSQRSKFTDQLPFTLTSTQCQAIDDICQDMNKPQPMNRLLEGDVGSGKTVVAATAAAMAHANGYKTLMLAPTQILATQHAITLEKFCSNLGIKIALVTANTKKREEIEQANVIIGTHALLNLTFPPKKVGLVIVDEQHRFGVNQRALATSLGHAPHTLTMTATPIPRSIALTVYGDLDVSLLSAPPTGRLPIKTWVVPQTKRDGAYDWMKNEMTEHSTQAFIVCPFIEPSESNSTIKAATQEVEKIKALFKDMSVTLLHGKLKPIEKDKILQEFKEKKHQILVTTPVVEVGIDIPNATIMVIEDADRFGLAQLHQLRGRVGRSDQQSYCLLFAQKQSPRLEALTQHTSGLELAEIDLKLRGPGDVYGTSQHGAPMFKVAKYTDLERASEAKLIAEQLLSQLETYPRLKKLVEEDKISSVIAN